MSPIPANHEGQIYGVVQVLALLPPAGGSRSRFYQCYWTCCSTHTIEGQEYLSKIRSQHPRACRACNEAKRPKANWQEDAQGYVDTEHWGRVYPLRGLMGR
jgi:hypothetical protein